MSDKSCWSCMCRYDDSDGPEYGPPAWTCSKHPSRSNLRTFPFRRAQECHVPWPPPEEAAPEEAARNAEAPC